MSKLDVKILTCHDVYNFGASLQAFALQTYLEGQGADVHIVDYKPYYQPSGDTSLFHVSTDKGWFRGIGMMLYLLPGKISRRGRIRKFDAFTSTRLHLTDRYLDLQELIAGHINADVFIVGSDQIWNGLYLTGRDSAFYLDFVKTAARKVAYAPSVSYQEDMDKRLEYFYRKELPKFDFVSVREKGSVPFLRRMGREDTEVVCDPVLLLSTVQWDNLLPPVPIVEGKYLLVYDFDDNKQIASIAKRIAKEEGLKIINISIDTLSGLGTRLRGIGPEEFLSLLRGASFVVSSSYHATLFSLLYHKRFCVVRRKVSINLRLEDLLDDYGLKARMVSDYSPSLLESIDGSDVDCKMKPLVEASKDYLDRALRF